MANQGRKIFTAFYALLIMAIGSALLGSSLLNIDLDIWRELVIIVVLGMISEWLVVSLPHGHLSVGFALVFTTFLLFDKGPFPGAAVLTSTLSAVLGNGIINKNSPIRVILFNGTQYAIAASLAGLTYHLMGGAVEDKLTWANAVPLGTFILTYFIANHLLVNIYVSRDMRRQSLSVWKAALRWDAITYLFAAPISLLMVFLYNSSEPMGITGVMLLFFPVLILKGLLKLYIKNDLANKELSALYEVAKSLGSSLDIEKILNLILEEARRVVKYHTGIIYLWREDENLLVPAAIQSPYHKQLRMVTVQQGEGIIGWAAKTGQATIVYDSKTDEQLRNEPGVTQFLRSLLVVPLSADDRVIGVMVLGRKEVDGFVESQMQLLTIMGSQAAVATAKALLYTKIERMAITDGLTKIYNHRFFYQRMEEEVLRATRYGKIFSLIMMDIDFFKKFNDSYGHKAGDKALATVARILKETTRNVDLVARYGGEEFAVILPETDKNGAMVIGDRIRRVIKNTPFEIDPSKPMVGVTVSVGVAGFPEDADNYADLVERADKALYQAKHTGKNKVCAYDCTLVKEPPDLKEEAR
ncbi:MAG: sensor domain-containing diguanylate cyclase [Clostridia bacterium]|nr:sensor domain-containing diguanylate cyclase [Clostridia bacterium]